MRLWVTFVLVLMLASSAFAGKYLMNDTGEAVMGLRVVFSEPVTITGYGDVLMAVEPQGKSTEFLFTGGEIDAWGGHWLNWEPASAALQSYEWLANLALSTSPSGSEGLPSIDFSQGAVIQGEDGTQQFRAELKFYPDKKEIEPGETVQWHLELGMLQGPLVIVPELDNNRLREPTIRTSDQTVTLTFRYTTPAIYVPYVAVTDNTGITRTIYTTNVLSVFPDLEPRSRIGIDIPTPDDPVGDVIKGVQILCLDEKRFSNVKGETGIKAEIAQWAAAGINLAMYNIPLFVSDVRANVTLPHYGDSAPVQFASTWALDSIVKLTDWAHELGMRVAIRPFMMTAADNVGVRRMEYEPTDLALYFHYHVQIKKILARLAEVLGVEMFSIDAENPVTTGHAEALDVVNAVREVFSGVVCNSPALDTGVLYTSPLTEHLDLIYISHGPYFNALAGAPAEQLEKSNYTQMVQEVLPILNRHKMPGIVETFVEKWPPADEQYQARGYRAIISFLHEHPSLLMGYTFWETSLDHRRYHSKFEPFRQPAENVLTTYFRDLIPESRTYSFEISFPIPKVLHVLNGFNSNVSRGQFVIGEGNGSVSLASSRGLVYEGTGAGVATFMASSSEGYRYFFLNSILPQPMDWSSYGSINIWVKTDGTRGKLRLEVWDSDGDRFTSLIATPPAEWGWVLVSVRLSNLYQPGWAQRRDGHLDLTRVAKWAFGQQCDEKRMTLRTFFDLAYLGD